MSQVTNVMLSVGYRDANLLADFGRKSAIDLVNDWLQDKGYRTLKSLNDTSLPEGWYGGNRIFEADVYVGAFNYLHIEEFIHYVASLNWIDGDCLQLLLMRQEDQIFQCYALNDMNSIEND